MITGHGSVEKAVEAMRLGAYDFIQKPLDSAALLKTVAKALEKQRLASENRQLRRQLQQRRGVEALIGDSPPMQAVKQLIRQIAAHRCQRAHSGRERHRQGNCRRRAASI